MKRSCIVGLLALWPSLASAQWTFEDFLDFTVHPETAIASAEAENLKGNRLQIICASKLKEPMDLKVYVSQEIYDAYPDKGTPDLVLSFDNHTMALPTKKPIQWTDSGTRTIAIKDQPSSSLLSLTKKMQRTTGPLTLTYGKYRFTFSRTGIEAALAAVIKTCDQPVP